jgi:hypothetical protein
MAPFAASVPPDELASTSTDSLKNKTINNALGVVVRICNLAARAWRDENGNR